MRARALPDLSTFPAPGSWRCIPLPGEAWLGEQLAAKQQKDAIPVAPCTIKDLTEEWLSSVDAICSGRPNAVGLSRPQKLTCRPALRRHLHNTQAARQATEFGAVEQEQHREVDPAGR